MRWNGKLAVVALAALMALPTAWSVQQDPVVAGHTTYADMDGLDPCIAGIVGIVRLRVMWFNDQVLFERTAGDGSSHVFAVQGGAADPRDQLLRPTGQQFAFTDPNGMEWQVNEYTYNVAPASASTGNTTVTPPSVQQNGNGVSVDNGETHVEPPTVDSHETGPWYTWVVQTGPTIEDFSATGRPYNFVNLVDTCKFSAPGQDVAHSNAGPGNWTSDWPEDTTEQQHFADEASHGHDRFSVDLYVGKAPKVEALANADPEYLGDTA